MNTAQKNTPDATTITLERLGWAAVGAAGALMQLANVLGKVGLNHSDGQSLAVQDMTEAEERLKGFRETIIVAERHLAGEHLAIVRRVKAALLGAQK